MDDHLMIEPSHREGRGEEEAGGGRGGGRRLEQHTGSRTVAPSQ